MNSKSLNVLRFALYVYLKYIHVDEIWRFNLGNRTVTWDSAMTFLYNYQLRNRVCIKTWHLEIQFQIQTLDSVVTFSCKYQSRHRVCFKTWYRRGGVTSSCTRKLPRNGVDSQDEIFRFDRTCMCTCMYVWTCMYVHDMFIHQVVQMVFFSLNILGSVCVNAHTHTCIYSGTYLYIHMYIYIICQSNVLI